MTTTMNGSASTTDFRARVGAMLAQARKEKGITQIQLAERLGMAQGSLSRIETGRYMSIDVIGRYLDAIGAELTIK